METSALDDLLDNEMVKNSKGNNAPPKSIEPSDKMKSFKAHLDLLAVSLIIIVSVYKIWDLSHKK
tara:strand:- start:1551 stop:1745 length:195 start_codon:yes stop_codon:yes gene_type:complete